MDDYVFSCTYCRELVSEHRAKIFYLPQEELADGRILVVYGTSCGSYCASMHDRYSISSGVSG